MSHASSLLFALVGFRGFGLESAFEAPGVWELSTSVELRLLFAIEPSGVGGARPVAGTNGVDDGVLGAPYFIKDSIGPDGISGPG